MSLESRSERPGPPPACVEPACERPAVTDSERCRCHLVGELTARGVDVPFADGELGELFAVVLHIVDTSLHAWQQRRRPATSTTTAIDLLVALDAGTDWAIVQMTLDMMGAHLADVFGGTRLSPPTEMDGVVVLHLQVIVPGPDEGSVEASLELALREVVREIVGPDVPFQSRARLTEGDG
jgi:hypothetical protein